MEQENKNIKQLLEEIEELRIRLEESEETISAIRSGEVDAIVVSGPQGDQVFTLTGAEQAYRVLIETMNEGAAVLNQEGMIIYCNQRLSEMIKTPLEKVIGAPMRQFIRASDLPVFDSLIKKGLQESAKGEFAFIKNDGTVLPVLFSISALQRDNANISNIIVTDLTAQKHIEEELRRHRDNLEELVKDRTNELETSNQQLQEEITERKKAADAVKYEKNKLVNIFEAMEDGVYVVNQNYDIEYVNPSLERDYGPWKGIKCYTYLHDRTEVCPWCPNQRVWAGETVRWEWSSSKNGKTYDILDTPLKNTDGSVSKLELFRDITERKKSEGFIKSILESVGEGFIVIDPDYRIITANRAYCEQSKMPLEDIINRYCYEISHHRDKPCYEAGERCASRHTFATGESCTESHTHDDKDGTPVYVEVKAYPMKDQGGSVISVIEIVNDITQKKKLEDQLRHAQKMEAVGQLAGGIAHDFNNILSAIIGYGYVTLMKMAKDDPLRLNIEQMLEASDRAAELTKSILAFSHKQMLDRRPVDLNEIIRKVEKYLKRIIGEDISINLTLSESGLNIFADSGQIEQVLMNLATNAHDAMPKGGLLSIETSMRELDNGFIKNHGYGTPGKFAVMTVSDSGMGMDEETRKRIMEPFFTTKEVGKGTGLGLSMAYGIITQHDGYINVYSEPEKGTTFRIYLPVIASAVSEEKKAPEAELQERGGETILFAEDDKQLRELNASLLQDFGYTVIVADDGEDAVKKFMENKDKVQLLLFDLVMPKKSGKEAYDEIRQINPDVRIIFMSGYAPDIILQKGLIEDGMSIISKPISPVDVLKKIRNVLNGVKN